MTNATTIHMTQEKPKIIDAARRKELKKTALKKGGTVGVAVEKPNGADKRKQQDIIELRQLLDDASTPEEAREMYEKLGKDLIPEEKFKELTKRFSPVETEIVPPAAAEETTKKTAEDELAAVLDEIAKTAPEETATAVPEPEKETASAPEAETEKTSPPIRVKIGAEEYPIEAYEEATEAETTVALRTALNEEISRLDQQLQDQTLKQFHEQIWRQIETLRKIDSSHDPLYELNRAYENGEISAADRIRIIGDISTAIVNEPETTTPEKPAADDLANETPDLYGFLEKTIRGQAQERTRQQKERKKQQTAIPADEAELAAIAKMRRMAKMRQKGASEEEIGAFEAVEAKFEPTPEMLAISEEINRVQKIAEQRLRDVQIFGQLDETALRALENLNFSLRHLESLRTNLRQVETIAREEFEEKKEAAKKLLGRTGLNHPQLIPWIHIENKQSEPEVTFGSKLRDALKRIIPIKEKKALTGHKKRHNEKVAAAALEQFTEGIYEAYAEGLISEEKFAAKKQLTDSLAKSANPLDDLDTAYAEGTLEDVLTEEEYVSLRKIF